jgi:hypothetical protein
MKWMHLPVVLAFFVAAQNARAQQFGGFPPSVKWKQINTDTARIIFPAAVDSQAQRIAAIIHKIVTRRPNSLGTTVRKINIILHNTTTLANGYVALAPFRSEYYLIPGSDIFEFGANPWYEELAVHEFRHVLQFSNFNRGLSRAAAVVLGEEGQALFNALVIPDWFWEGDAVHAETSLTPQGRGRTPFFFNGFNSLWREGRDYSWMKLRSGSLKDYVPDHYQLGYLLVNYGYLKYGPEFWGKVTADAAAYKGLFYPFQKAVKKYSGVPYRTFRQQALGYYSHQVSKKRTDLVRPSTVTNYYFPQFIGGDSLLYLKSSYKSLSAFYIRDGRGEHRLRLKNISTEDWFSYRNGLIAYTAYETDPRWSLRDYSSIYVFNIHTGRQTKITRKGKFYTPDISPSGKKIIAVSVDATTATSLQLLDTAGTLLKTVRAAHSNFVHPRFIDENTIVVAERLPNSMMQLSLMDLNTGKKDQLIPPTPALIGYPFFYEGAVYFVSSVSGNDEIYSIRLSDKKCFSLPSAMAGGRYYPSVYGDSLTWSVFSSNGLLMQEKAMDIHSGVAVDVSRWNQLSLPFAIANADTASNVLPNLSRVFPESRYRQGAHLFNFHSRRPDYTDPEFTLSLFSNNMLNTFTNELFYRYNKDETSHTFGFNSSYGGFYPVINTGFEYTFDRTVGDPFNLFELNQVEARAGYNIPLDLTRGKMYKFLNFGSNYVYNHAVANSRFTDTVGLGSHTYLHHFISWSNYLPEAVQQIYPKFGYTMAAAHRHLLHEKGFQFLGSASLFLPSFMNHSIVLTASLQETDSSNRVFSNRFANSRGYSDSYFTRMWKLGANYHFPIAYPDVGFANIIFVQRLRGNAFYDFTRVYSRDKLLSRDLRSVGGEIYFDTKMWNALPVTFGFRVSHLLDNGFNAQDRRGANWFEFILPVNLIPSN